MSEHELLTEIREELRHLREDVLNMATANDTALAALQAAATQLTTDVEALLAAVAAGSSDDISAGVDAVTSSLTSLDSSVTAATAGSQGSQGAQAPAAPSPAPAPAPADPAAPVDAPSAPPAPGA
jgi:hypothetical protein